MHRFVRKRKTETHCQTHSEWSQKLCTSRRNWIFKATSWKQYEQTWSKLQRGNFQWWKRRELTGLHSQLALCPLSLCRVLFRCLKRESPKHSTPVPYREREVQLTTGISRWKPRRARWGRESGAARPVSAAPFSDVSPQGRAPRHRQPALAGWAQCWCGVQPGSPKAHSLRTWLTLLKEADNGWVNACWQRPNKPPYLLWNYLIHLWWQGRRHHRTWSSLSTPSSCLALKPYPGTWGCLKPTDSNEVWQFQIGGRRYCQSWSHSPLLWQSVQGVESDLGCQEGDLEKEKAEIEREWSLCYLSYIKSSGSLRCRWLDNDSTKNKRLTLIHISDIHKALGSLLFILCIYCKESTWHKITNQKTPNIASETRGEYWVDSWLSIFQNLRGWITHDHNKTQCNGIF